MCVCVCLQFVCLSLCVFVCHQSSCCVSESCFITMKWFYTICKILIFLSSEQLLSATVHILCTVVQICTIVLCIIHTFHVKCWNLSICVRDNADVLPASEVCIVQLWCPRMGPARPISEKWGCFFCSALESDIVTISMSYQGSLGGQNPHWSSQNFYCWASTWRLLVVPRILHESRFWALKFLENCPRPHWGDYSAPQWVPTTEGM